MATLWRRDPGAWEVPTEHRKNSSIDLDKKSDGSKTKRWHKRGKEPAVEQARVYEKFSQGSLAAWWRKTLAGKKPPTPEQRRFLESVFQRSQKEFEEFNVCKGPRSKEVSA